MEKQAIYWNEVNEVAPNWISIDRRNKLVDIDYLYLFPEVKKPMEQLVEAKTIKQVKSFDTIKRAKPVTVKQRSDGLPF